MTVATDKSQRITDLTARLARELEEKGVLHEEIERLRTALTRIALHDGMTMLHPEPDTEAEDRAYQQGVAKAYGDLAAVATEALGDPQ